MELAVSGFTLPVKVLDLVNVPGVRVEESYEGPGTRGPCLAVCVSALGKAFAFQLAVLNAIKDIAAAEGSLEWDEYVDDFLFAVGNQTLVDAGGRELVCYWPLVSLTYEED